jgi:diacylglycerol kinase family enzyme
MATQPLCVIFNPTAGKHRAARRLEKLRLAWGDHVVFQPTAHPGHAVELARAAADAGFEIVAAAGGDGTAHEVANGLLLAGRPGVGFGLFPIGSANDYAHSVAAKKVSGPFSVDVGRVRSPAGRMQYFVCCLGLGLNGAVTLESRRIKLLQGIALYGLATLRALWRHYACPRMQITLDDQAPWETETLMFSTLVGKREGGFVLAPKAELDDGWFDYIHAGALSRWQVLKFLPRLALFGAPDHDPQVRQGRCRRVRLVSTAPLIVHLDGEFFCTLEDNVRELEIELLPRALQVEVLSA